MSGLAIDRRQDLGRTCRQQLLGNLLAEQHGIGRSTTGFSLQELAAIETADAALQAELAIVQGGKAGDGHLATALQARVHGALGADANGGIEMIQRCQQRTCTSIIEATLNTHGTLANSRQQQRFRQRRRLIQLRGRDPGVKSTFLTWVSQLMNNDVDWNGNVWGVITPNAWLQMETINDFVSIDFNDVKPLVQGAPPVGQYREWLGVKWVRHTGLTGKGTSAAKCYIYSGDAIGHQIDGEPMTHMYYEDEEDRYGTWVKTIHCAALVLTRGVYRAVHDDTASIA